MTTAVESVITEVRQYIAAVGGDPTAVPEPLAALADFVVGGLLPGERVLRAVCLLNRRADGSTAAGLAVLTDAGLLLAEEGPYGRRIAPQDFAGISEGDVPAGDGLVPSLAVASAGAEDRLMAYPVEGSSAQTLRAELQQFSRRVERTMGATGGGSAASAPANPDATRPAAVAAPPVVQADAAKVPAAPVLPAPVLAAPSPAAPSPAASPAAPVPPAAAAQPGPAAYGPGSFGPPPSSPPAPARPRRKPHYVAGTFWVLVALGALIATFQGQPAMVLVSLLAAAYSVYLYRGGRIVVFFFPI